MSATSWMSAAAAITCVFAQQGRTITLGAPEAEFREPFSQIEGVRELRDGRVIVIDGRERLVQALDMKTGTATRIGREGSGPGEYMIPRRLFALPGDSSAVSDMGNGSRALIVTPDGNAGGTLPRPGEAPLFSDRSATDARGRVYSEVRMVRRTAAGVPMPSDSSGIERLDRATGKRDTLALVGSQPVSPLLSKGRPRPGAGAATGGPVAAGSRAIPPFWSRNQWAVATDGRIAIVTVSPYQVTLVDETGRRTVSRVLDAGHVRITDALKQQWRDDARRPGPVLVYSGNGQTSATSRPGRFEEPAEWPDELPPFLDQAVSFAPDGSLWIRRAVAADAPPIIDVIGRDAKLAYQVALPKGTKLVGFGASSVYLVRVDADDLQYLQRYRLPASR